MGLESGTYINDLNISNPIAGDNLSQADEHFRLIKSTVKATFPNVTGEIARSHTQLNLTPVFLSVTETSPGVWEANPTPAYSTAPAIGSRFFFFAPAANNGACTLTLNALSPVSIVKNSSALVEGDIDASAPVEIVYNGTNFQIISVGKQASISLPPTSKKNLLQNCLLNVNQRALPGYTVSSGVYTYDCWYLNCAAPATGTMLRVIQTINGRDIPTIRLSVGTADAVLDGTDVFHLNQSLEGFDIIPLIAKTFTLSFWIKANLTGTFCVSFVNSTSFLSRVSYVAPFTITTADVWQRVIITVPGGLPNTGQWATPNQDAALYIVTSFGAGATYQTASPNTWQSGVFFTTSSASNIRATAGAQINIALPQLEAYESASEFEFVNASDEFNRCLRYLEVGTQSLVYMPIPGGYAAAYGHEVFRERKRAAPSITITQSFGYYTGGSKTTFTPTIYNPNVFGFGYGRGSGFNTWNGWTGVGVYIASAEI